MDKRLNWGIIGAGNIAKAFSEGLEKSNLGTLYAVASRSQEKADAFAKTHTATKAYGSYEALLADPAVEAVYLAIPHPGHVRWGIAALEAGKHLLCEKPLCLNHAEATVLAATAQRLGLTLSEAFMYRAHPQTQKIVDLVREGAIGKLHMIQASFGFASEFNPSARLWASQLGGGGILDVGCYPVSFARLLAGAASGKPFANPVAVSGQALLHPQTGVDARAAATLRFEDGIIAEVSTSIDTQLGNSARIYGSEGSIEVAQPWTHQRTQTEFQIRLHRHGQEPETITLQSDRTAYTFEADAFAKAVRLGETNTCFMPIADTLGNLATLDKWRQSIGLTHSAEKVEALGKNTFAGRPLRADSFKGKNGSPLIAKATVAGIPLPVSRLVMGCDNQMHLMDGAAVWDHYFEAGGNAFDTAWGYGGGRIEINLGHWMRARGVRSQCVLLVKGAHTPFCNPEALEAQLNESLERLQTDHAQIYLMHRDNLDIPVGEFVDVLNRAKQAGKIDIFGGSNWTLSRVREANAYAQANGLQGFTAVSNNFSLARMESPVWGGCESAANADWREELGKGNITLLPWSSQARGFFTDRAGPDKRNDEELVRCWYSDGNFERRRRAFALAEQLGVEPINIALAYVLAQPFQTLPLIGPRSIAETVSSARAFEVDLTPEHLAWLDLKTDKQPA